MMGAIMSSARRRSLATVYDYDWNGGIAVGSEVVARSGSATYINSSGWRANAAPNTLRISYEGGVPNRFLGVMVEPASTNLISMSNNPLGGYPWGGSYWTHATSGATGLSGVVNDMHTFTTTGEPGGSIAFLETPITSGDRMAVSWYLRPGTGVWFSPILHNYDTFADPYVTWCNLTTKTFGTTQPSTTFTNVVQSIREMAGGWREVKLEFDTIGVVRLFVQITFCTADATHLSPTGLTFQFDSLQIEKASVGTSYIPVPGTTPVTRGAEAVSVPMSSGSYDILVEDIDGGEWRNAVTVSGGLYPLSPRAGKRHILRVRSFPAGSLTQAQKDDLIQPRLAFAIFHTTLMDYSDGQGFLPMLQDDVRTAAELGVNGFAINSFWYEQAVGELSSLMDSADVVGAANFKFFVNCDMGLNFANPVPDGQPVGGAGIIKMISDWGGHPRFLKIDGKPVLGTYGGQDLGDAWWQNNVITPLNNAGKPVTFIPNFDRSDQNSVQPTLANWNTVLDTYPVVNGLQNFLIHIGTPFRTTDPRYGSNTAWSILDGMEAEAEACRTRGKYFIPCVAPYYFATRHSVRQYYEYQGGRGLENQWRSIIETMNAKFVNLLTWNDWHESHYYQPTKVPDSHPGIPAYPHLGYYELSKYFIRWYLMRQQPTITKDAFFYFHRTTPKNAVATSDSTYNAGITWDPSKIIGSVNDVIFITTALTAPAEMRVTSGGVLTTYNVPAGLSHTDAPFNVGAQHLELWRNSVKLAESDGAAVISNPPAYNFNVNSGYAIVGGTTSVTWTISSPGQVNPALAWFA